jgi:aquaporin Z
MNAVLVEFLGTTVFVGVIAFVGTPLAIAAALFVAILLGGPISGGHFNPAVTLWSYLSGTTPMQTAALYGVAQVLAATTVVGLKRWLA